jgi:hypothetical protein
MKIGIICEGVKKGADINVYTFLAEKILPNVEVIPVSLGNKLEREDCDLIRQSLNAAQLNLKQLSRVHLVCMEQELETLFLTDEQMIAVYLTQKSGRSCNVVNYSRYPTRPLDPKSVVDKFFREHTRQKHPYNATIDAEKMIQYVTIKKLKRCASFVRFAMKITDGRVVSRTLGIPLTQLMPEKQSREEEQ